MVTGKEEGHERYKEIALGRRLPLRFQDTIKNSGYMKRPARYLRRWSIVQLPSPAYRHSGQLKRGNHYPDIENEFSQGHKRRSAKWLKRPIIILFFWELMRHLDKEHDF